MAEQFPKVEYKVELRLNGKLLGNCRRIAENLVWARRRVKMGVDSISFTVNDFLFSEWCEERGITLIDVLKPLALDCRIVRNGTPLVGGYLAAMPGYQPSGSSASLNLQFDGYLNYLAGVFIAPKPTETEALNSMILGWINEAENRAEQNGKGFGFSSVYNNFTESAYLNTQVTQSFDDYKDIKAYITDRCDNKSGAGEFDLYFTADKGIVLMSASRFGTNRTNEYTIQYPAQINIPSATQLSAGEVSGFASCVIGIGNGETSGTAADNTAIVSRQVNEEAVKEFGYAEATLSASSVSIQATLDANTATELAQRSTMVWQPEIQLSGRMFYPKPIYRGAYAYPSVEDERSKKFNDDGKNPIGIGDWIAIQNRADMTGMTSGVFRVEELEVTVDATGAEIIKPTLSREGTSVNNFTFAQEFVRMQNEIRALKAKK